MRCALLMVCAWLAQLLLCGVGRAADEAVIIHNAEQFNRHLDALALEMQNRCTFVFKRPELLQARSIAEASLWYDYGNRYKAAIYPHHVATFEFEFKDNARILAAHLNPELRPLLHARERLALREAQERVQRLVRTGMTDEQKFRALHDDLVIRGCYTQEPKSDVADLLLEGCGTCEAYSRTLWLLCRMCELPCHIIYGEAGEPHAWNLVCLEGVWYHTDATWNDPVNPEDEEEHTLSHRYFLLNDAEMAEDHAWKQGPYPKACAKDADFFRNNGRVFEEDEALWRALEDAIDSGLGSMELYLPHYRSREDFAQRLNQAMRHRPTLRAIMAWQAQPLHQAAVLLFTFANGGEPMQANMENLNFTEGIVVETRRMLDRLDTEALHRLKHQAQGGWELLWDCLLRLWQELCKLAELIFIPHPLQYPWLEDVLEGIPASCAF